MSARNDHHEMTTTLLSWRYDPILTEDERLFLLRLHQQEEITTKERKALRQLAARLSRLACT